MKKTVKTLSILAASAIGVAVWFVFHFDLQKEFLYRLLGPSYRAQEYVKSGAKAYRQENYESAIAHFQAAIQLDPRSKIAKLDLANTYAHRYQHTESAFDFQMAADEYKVVLDDDPQNPVALQGLGSLYVIADKAEGRTYLTRAAMARHVMNRSDDLPADEDVPPLTFKQIQDAEEARKALEREQPSSHNTAQTSGQQVTLPYSMVEPNLIHKVAPHYPEMAKMAHVQGDVVLEALISKTGAIKKLQATSGHPVLIQAATDAVRQWRYRPVLVNGKPTDVQTTITIKFPM